MKLFKSLWWKWSRRRTPEERDLMQVHRLSQEVVRVILARVGEPVLRETLRVLEENRTKKGESDYTSLAEIWLKADEMYNSRGVGS